MYAICTEFGIWYALLYTSCSIILPEGWWTLECWKTMTRLSLEPHNSPNVSTNLLYEYEYDTEMFQKNLHSLQVLFYIQFFMSGGIFRQSFAGKCIIVCKYKKSCKYKVHWNVHIGLIRYLFTRKFPRVIWLKVRSFK